MKGIKIFFNKKKKKKKRHKNLSENEKQNYDHGHNIMRPFDILLNIVK